MRKAPVLLLAAVASAGLAPYGHLIEAVRPGEAPHDSYGEKVAGGADVNGDGRADHLVTAIFNDDAASAAGKAYLYLGRAPLSPVADLTFLGEAADDQFGVSAAVGGDINGDGHGDIAVGARFNDRAGKDVGTAFVYYGGRNPGSPGGMDAQPDLVLTGEFQDDWFGTSVDFAGDVNGDGFDDILVGAPFNDDRATASGKGYLFLGGATPDAIADVFLFGDTQDDGQFGWSVSGAGDVNGDGFDDVVIGARLYGAGPSRATGRAYIFFGGVTPDGLPDVIITGERRDDWFGNTVSEADDFNRDGFDDVAVGAIFWDDFTDLLDPKSAAGKVYVFYGGPAGTMDGIADWSASGERADDHFGFAIATGRDVDGNGGSDLLVGARFYDELSAPARLNAGKIYVFWGSPGGSAPASAPGFTAVGRAAEDQFGSSVGGAGDGNEDGLAEFLAGAHFGSIGGSTLGSTTLHFLDCLDIELTGSQIAWGGCGSFASFDIRRGTPAGFRMGDFGSCLAGGLPGPPATDDQIPPPGEAFTYLVSGQGVAPQAAVALGFAADAKGRPPQTPCP